MWNPALGQIGEHLAGDGRIRGVLVGVLVALTQLRGRPGVYVLDRVDGVRQAGQQQHEGRSPGIHRSVSEARGLDDGLLGPECGGGGDDAQSRRRARRRLFQGGAGSRGGVPGHRQQGARHGARDRGPRGVRHGLVGVHEFNGAQAGGVGGVCADVGEGSQSLGDQKARVSARATHSAIGCSPCHLRGVGGPPQAVKSVRGRAQGEQDIGSRIGIRHGEDVEDVDEIACLIGDDLCQRDPAPHCGTVQHTGPGDRDSGAVSLRLRHLRLPWVPATTTTPCISRCEHLLFHCMICICAGVQRAWLTVRPSLWIDDGFRVPARTHSSHRRGNRPQRPVLGDREPIRYPNH